MSKRTKKPPAAAHAIGEELRELLATKQQYYNALQQMEIVGGQVEDLMRDFAKLRQDRDALELQIKGQEILKALAPQ